jgi:tetratricopeptide (TPR) repeat protein
MRRLFIQSVVVFLASLGFLALASPDTYAAMQHDSKIEALDITYRVGDANTGEETIHERLRSLTGQGRANLSKIQIPYASAFQDVEFKYLKTLKKDGTVVSGDPAGAFDTKAPDPLAPVFTDVISRTILPPNLDTGDSVEFEVVIHIHRWPKPGDFWFAQYLTSDVPVLAESVVLDLPAERKVALYENPHIRSETEVSNGRRIERWITAIPEPPKASVEGPELLFAVSSMLSWDEFGRWMHSLNHSAAEPTPEIRALAARLTANKSSEPDRIAALYGYVATKVRYVSISFGLGRLQPHTAASVLQNAYGDCKDQTALLSALLLAAGFKPHGVLITPNAGVRQREVPTPDHFNHEFTAVETNSGLVFLDPSMGPVAPQVLQPGVRGRSALLLGDTSSSIIEIPKQSPVPSRVAATLKGRVTAAGLFEGSSRFEFWGLPELVLRRIFLDGSDAEKESALRELAGPELRGANVRQVLNSDPGDLATAFWVQCELSQNDFFPPAKKSMKITIDLPSSPVELLEKLQKPENPFQVESYSISRRMDLIVGPSLTITNSMPVHRKAAFGSFDSEFSFNAGHLILARSLNLNGTAIDPADWDGFLDFVRAAQSEIAQGFTLERSASPPPTAVSAETRSIHEGAEALQRRDFEAAKRDFLEATKLAPQSAPAWNGLGQSYLALREYDQAEKALKRLVELDPKHSSAYNTLGRVYVALRLEDEAIACFQKQIAVNPRDPHAHEYLSRSFWDTRQWERAREEAAIAADISPDEAMKWARLGVAQAKTHLDEDASRTFERALALPHDSMLENEVAYGMADAGIQLHKAWTLVSGALTAEADRVCRPETLSKEDKCALALRRIGNMTDTAGWVLFRRGKYAEAEPYLLSAYAINPSIIVTTHVSALYSKLGRVDEALKYLANVRSRPGFIPEDAGDLLAELAKAVGGETELDSRLMQLQAPSADNSTVKVIALVDEQGTVLEAQTIDPQAPAYVTVEAKSLTLLPIAWPEHSLRSIRIIEFSQAKSKWLLLHSHTGLGRPLVTTP